MKLERVFEDLSFSALTNLVQAGGRLFVTEQAGLVRSFPNRADVSEAAVYLDIRHLVNKGGSEEGLLGLAFDPEFDSNGHFYVYYSATRPRRSVISRFTVAPPNAASARPESKIVVMEIPQPFQNHNGGQLAFGPDGMLYIALGDGGAGGDPRGNGQNVSTLLGSILRIDVSELGPDAGYRVPPDNPFVGSQEARSEIWAHGLRNPWRFSFDRQNGDLWAGDVGQNAFEEVSCLGSRPQAGDERTVLAQVVRDLVRPEHQVVPEEAKPEDEAHRQRDVDEAVEVVEERVQRVPSKRPEQDRGNDEQR